MHKIKIRLPATLTNLGPGLESLGLAIGLYTTVEITSREDDQLTVDLHGLNADEFDSPVKHPVVTSMTRFFQQLERTQAGLHIRVENQIPLRGGLGAETAFAVAGALGANDLLGNPYRRDEILELASLNSRADGATAALLGGLTSAILEDGELIYRSLPIKSFQIVVVVPTLKSYTPPILPEQITLRDALHNLKRLPLLLKSLEAGDFGLLIKMLDDRIQTPRLTAQITGYGPVVEIARQSGALAVTTCGDGPALLALAESRHKRIAEAMEATFKGAGVEARAWVLPVDTQGVVISAVG